MVWEREIAIDGTRFSVTISDEYEALRSAFADGRAVIGLWNRNETNQCLSPASYLVESTEDITPEFLERVVRRNEGLPWNITKTNRLLIRELIQEDASHMPIEPDGGSDGEMFYNKETLNSYIKNQYPFYEYGIWAVTDLRDGTLLGKAGLSNLVLSKEDEFHSYIKKNDTPIELGYHIFTPYRCRGYAKEACQAILEYGATYLTNKIYARVLEENRSSVCLLERLGFIRIGQTRSKLTSVQCLYEWNYS